MLNCTLSGPPCREDKGTSSKRRTAKGGQNAQEKKKNVSWECPAVPKASWRESRQLSVEESLKPSPAEGLLGPRQEGGAGVRVCPGVSQSLPGEDTRLNAGDFQTTEGFQAGSYLDGVESLLESLRS